MKHPVPPHADPLLQPSVLPKRRRFLSALLSLGAAGAVVAQASHQKSTAKPEPLGNEMLSDSTGYQETPHIKTYYHIARF